MRNLNSERPDELQARLKTMIETSDARLTRRHMLTGAASAGLLLASPMRRALAQARVTVTEGNFQPIPIAIPNFVPGGQGDGEVAAGIAQVITNNLKRSGLFAPIDQAAFIERISNIDVPPQFANWRQINAQALVTAAPRGRAMAASRLNSDFGTCRRRSN